MDAPQVRQVARLVFAGALLAAAALLLIVLFDRIPIEGTTLAIDWKAIWDMIAGGALHYQVGKAFFIAPWDVAVILPLGLLSLRASWGLLAFMTLALEVASVPRIANRGRYWLAVLLLVVSFPSIRHMVDGELEGLVIAGVLLVVYAYRVQRPVLLALGILSAVAKPQDSILLIAALGVYALPDLRQPLWRKTAAVLALIVVPFMLWKGADWLAVVFSIREQGSIMDTSLHAALTRAGIPPVVMWAFWLALLAATAVVVWRSRPALSREKAGMLIAASLLLSPYAAGNSILTVLAVGVVPLFLRRPWLGGVLMLLISLPYLWTRDMLFYGQAYYGTAVLLIAWAVFAWGILRGEDVAVGRIPGDPFGRSAQAIAGAQPSLAVEPGAPQIAGND